MDSFTSMKTKLEATGLYKIEEGSNIFAELSAYAAGLDVLFETLDKMLAELFIDTAEDYGLSCREELLGKVKNDYPIDRRREMLKIYEQMMGGKCTLDAFEMILRGYGLSDFQIREDVLRKRVTIKVTDNAAPELRALVEERVALDFPTHLLVTVNYSEQ